MHQKQAIASKPKRRSGGRPSLEEARILSERIVEVATKQFLAWGYQDTTFHRIAQEAGTSKGAIYVRFPDKISLFSHVCKSLIAKTYLENIVDLRDDLPLRASLRQTASALVFATLQPNSIRLYEMITQNAPRHPELTETIKTVWDSYVDQLELYFRNRVERKLLSLRDPAHVAAIFASMIFSPIHIAFVQRSDVPSNAAIEAHIDESVLIFLGGIGRLEIETP